MKILPSMLQMCCFVDYVTVTSLMIHIKSGITQAVFWVYYQLFHLELAMSERIFRCRNNPNNCLKFVKDVYRAHFDLVQRDHGHRIKYATIEICVFPICEPREGDFLLWYFHGLTGPNDNLIKFYFCVIYTRCFNSKQMSNYPLNCRAGVTLFCCVPFWQNASSYSFLRLCKDDSENILEGNSRAVDLSVDVRVLIWMLIQLNRGYLLTTQSAVQSMSFYIMKMNIRQFQLVIQEPWKKNLR